MSGIGGVTEAMLLGVVGVSRVGELMEHRAALRLLYSDTHFTSLMATALGLGSTHFSAFTLSLSSLTGNIPRVVL